MRRQLLIIQGLRHLLQISSVGLVYDVKLLQEIMGMTTR